MCIAKDDGKCVCVCVCVCRVCVCVCVCAMCMYMNNMHVGQCVSIVPHPLFTAQLSTLFSEEEMRHLTACERIMREKGKLDLTILQSMLSGAPLVGKSTLLDRLVGKLPNDIQASVTQSLTDSRQKRLASLQALEWLNGSCK